MPSGVIRRPGTATLMMFQAFAPGTRLCGLLPQLANVGVKNRY
jgi:hypothetical protein